MKEKDKKKKKRKGKSKGKKKGSKPPVCGRGERRKVEKETSLLRSTEIGPWVFVGERDKVGPRNEGYAWVPKSRGFIKLQKLGSFPTLNISSLKVI